jgi:hypothetical protein
MSVEWYRQQGVVELEYGGGSSGTLIITRDDMVGGIDTPAIEGIIRDAFGG